MKLYDMFMKLNDMVTSEAFKVCDLLPYIVTTKYFCRNMT